MSRAVKGFEAKRIIGRGTNKRTVTVQLLSTTVGDKHSLPYYIPGNLDLSKIKKPTKFYGNYLPSDFEVFGLPCKIVFRVDKVPNAKGKNFFQITHITFDCPKGLQSSDTPIDLLRTLAVQASGFVAEALPANTRIDHSPGNYTATDEKGGFWVIGHAKTPSDTEKAFVGARPTGADLYKEIGRIYSQAKYGEKYKAIARAFGRTLPWAYKHTARGAKDYPQLFKGYKQKPKRKKGRKTK